MGLDNPLHIAFLLVILLLVFGAKRLPEMGRSLGEGLRGFKDTMSGESRSDSDSVTTADRRHEPENVAAATQSAPTPERQNVLAAAKTLGGAQRGEVLRDSELAAR